MRTDSENWNEFRSAERGLVGGKSCYGEIKKNRPIKQLTFIQNKTIYMTGHKSGHNATRSIDTQNTEHRYTKHGVYI